jgi:hypothetical protein
MALARIGQEDDDHLPGYAMAQRQKRMERIAKARDPSLEQVERWADLGEAAD